MLKIWVSFAKETHVLCRSPLTKGTRPEMFDPGGWILENRPFEARLVETRFLGTRFLETRVFGTRFFRTRFLKVRFLGARIFRT